MHVLRTDASGGWGGGREEPVKITVYRNSGKMTREYVAYALVFFIGFITCGLNKLTLQTSHTTTDGLSDLRPIHT